MAGQRQKAVELLQFHRGGRDRALVVYDDGDRTVPPLPRGCGRVGAVARQAWRELWSSPVRAVLDRHADGAALREYVLLVDERERLRTCMAAGERTAPVVARMAQAERQLQKLREHLALTPLSRFRLQLKVLPSGEQQPSLRGRLLADVERGTPAELPEPPAAVELDDILEPWRRSGR
ncbi:P27 family phage terminase small subunit [Tepidiforma thermophila]|uniref:Phage terminase small subunit n=1 Tax=Tepidiforma thermophila (strain KCTC 52669 / CGMCC 1.13589 / G233) TaxID=2761530 RepID=A0A2A9HF98_TEPT2|nr:P27 family phage terminase small subunit [Tepidiforma thermophila]PFG73821.1 phage terminase small subunit [Tepidiforma thermophila]